MLEEKIYKDNQEPPKNVIWHKVSDAGQDLGYYKNTNNKRLCNYEQRDYDKEGFDWNSLDANNNFTS